MQADTPCAPGRPDWFQVVLLANSQPIARAFDASLSELLDVLG